MWLQFSGKCSVCTRFRSRIDIVAEYIEWHPSKQRNEHKLTHILVTSTLLFTLFDQRSFFMAVAVLITIDLVIINKTILTDLDKYEGPTRVQLAILPCQDEGLTISRAYSSLSTP